MAHSTAARGTISLTLGMLSVLAGTLPAVNGEEVIYYTADFTSGSTNFPAKGLSVWVPEDVPLRGMLWILPGRGGDSRSYLFDPGLQEPARALGLGLIGLDNSDSVQYAGNNLQQFTDNFNAALNGAAAAASRPEISNAPVAFQGFSWGGWNSSRFASAVPDRVICYVNDKYSSTTNLLVPEAARVPGLFVSGQNDTSYGSTTIKWFNTWRGTHGADVALIADWGQGHSWTSQDIVWTHIAQAMKERYPQGQLPTATDGVTLATVPTSTAWLGQSNRVSSNVLTSVGWPDIAPYSEYTGDASKASWLINETEALVYRAHNTTNPPLVNITPNIGDNYYLEVYGWGQEIMMQVSFAGDPSTITDVQIYHDDQLLVDSDTFLSTGLGELTYLPTYTGIHAFTTVITYQAGGQQMYSSDYWAAAVVPEPSMLALLCCGWVLAFRRHRQPDRHRPACKR